MRHAPINLVLAVTLLIVCPLTLQAENWRGIIPLKSTRADVERMLGKPLPGNLSTFAVYRLEIGEVNIRYAARGLCRETDRCECRVPDDTVIDVVVNLQAKDTFGSLKIDKREFDRFPLVENTNIIIYRNAQAGIIYAVSQSDDRILYVQYGPAERDCQNILKRTLPVTGKPEKARGSCQSRIIL